MKMLDKIDCDEQKVPIILHSAYVARTFCLHSTKIVK
jgi:hypothetical protein